MSIEKANVGGGGIPTGDHAAGQSRLQQYINARVMVYYNSQSSYTDSGRVSYLDTHWLELTKDNGERLLMPTAAVRILKMLEPIRSTEDSDMLLRPLAGPPPNEEKVNPK